MRWFKHLSMAHADPALCTLLEMMGPEAYGIYWLLLEHFAAVMEKDCITVPELTHSEIKWAQICSSSARKFRNFAETAAKLKLIESSSEAELKQFASRMPANRLRICIPKLLKYRDEYSRKSGHSPDKLPARTDTDTDTDTEEKKKEEPPVPQATKADKTEPFNPPEWVDSEIWSAYLDVRKAKKAAKTTRAWNLVLRELEKFRAEGYDANEILSASVRSNWTDVYRPKTPPPKPKTVYREMTEEEAAAAWKRDFGGVM